MNAIADTGFLVALLEVHDEHHAWALELAEDIEWPALTCESVVSETAFQVRSSKLLLEMLQNGMLRLAFDFAGHLEHLLDLATRRNRVDTRASMPIRRCLCCWRT